MSDPLDRIVGWCCPVDGDQRPFTRLIEGPHFDAEGYQRASRINGIAQCPDCGLWWPLVEEIEAWTDGSSIPSGKFAGKWVASEWGPGVANCLECDVVIVDSFDGTYLLRC